MLGFMRVWRAVSYPGTDDTLTTDLGVRSSNLFGRAKPYQWVILSLRKRKYASAYQMDTKPCAAGPCQGALRPVLGQSHHWPHNDVIARRGEAAGLFNSGRFAISEQTEFTVPTAASHGLGDLLLRMARQPHLEDAAVWGHPVRMWHLFHRPPGIAQAAAARGLQRIRPASAMEALPGPAAHVS